jgi:hypothetical protein
MIALQSGGGMVEENHILIGAIRKLALASEQSGFRVEEIIELLKTGVGVETLLDLMCCADRSIDSLQLEEVKHGDTILPEVQTSPSGSSLRLR